MWKYIWSKTWKKEQVALFALLTNSYFQVGRHTHGALLAPQHSVTPRCAVPEHATRHAPSSQQDQVSLCLGGCMLTHHWFVNTAWEVLRSQQLLFSLVTTAHWMRMYLAGWISNLADSEEDCNSRTESLILDPDWFLHLWVPVRGGFMLEKGLTGIVYNLFLFPFPPFSSFTKC